LCSALLLAYFRSQASPRAALHIPLANLARADLDLRAELTAVLRRAGLAPADLPCLSDLPRDLAAGATRWLLADHNAPTGALAARFAAAPVVGCVDHHADEGVVPADTGAEPRVVRPCGSCMSLVVELSRDAWAALAAREPDAEADCALAAVALAPILVDTANLTSREKTTETDVEAVRTVEGYLQSAGRGPFNRDGYYDELSRCKEDLSGFGYRDVLRKDYKQWEEGGLVLGVSCVVRGLDHLLGEIGDKEEMLKCVKAWAAERGLDIAAVMTTHTNPDGQFVRELLVWATSDEATSAVGEFVGRFAGDLKLEQWRDGYLDAGEGEWRRCWRQHNLGASRKQVAPILREAIKASSPAGT